MTESSVLPKPPRLMLTNGAIFPLFLNASLLSRGNPKVAHEIQKQRVIEIIKNHPKCYLSDVADILAIPVAEAVELVSELKKEGRIKSR